ncbi:Mitochondrial pyruvate carrier 4 [Porphyridium purpureum]|uniref:Mitochondrial pyruvate carrier n=1 Tax=Porphyridium purpureum TaxID=35688 RepID=A0A5J4Z7P3_PORPP|nr:Mitochondrial pyruvate carrier 4 [Porphyridium purpureum]|eukprot:POR0043..scf295_1
MASARLKELWNHPAGLKTVFFWAPTMKWGLVAANFADMKRPPNTISVPTNIALAATGCIWFRWSFVIVPKNYNLALVNLFVAGTSMYQLYRVYTFRNLSEAAEAESA